MGVWEAGRGDVSLSLVFQRLFFTHTEDSTVVVGELLWRLRHTGNRGRFYSQFLQLPYSSATLYSYSIKWLVVLQIISLCRLQFILFLSIIMHNCRFAISLFSDHLLCQVLNFHYSCGSGSAFFFLQIFESRLENRS